MTRSPWLGFVGRESETSETFFLRHSNNHPWVSSDARMATTLLPTALLSSIARQRYEVTREARACGEPQFPLHVQCVRQLTDPKKCTPSYDPWNACGNCGYAVTNARDKYAWLGDVTPPTWYRSDRQTARLSVVHSLNGTCPWTLAVVSALRRSCHMALRVLRTGHLVRTR